jgi:hypothetical protein
MLTLLQAALLPMPGKELSSLAEWSGRFFSKHLPHAAVRLSSCCSSSCHAAANADTADACWPNRDYIRNAGSG